MRSPATTPPTLPPPEGRPRATAPEATPLLHRALSHGLSMAVVAAGVWWFAGERSAAKDAELEALNKRLDRLEQDHHRVRRLNDELALAAHDAGVAAEVAKWQISVLEGRIDPPTLEPEGMPVPSGLSPRAAWADDLAREAEQAPPVEAVAAAPVESSPAPRAAGPVFALQLRPLLEPPPLQESGPMPMVPWAAEPLSLSDRDPTISALHRAPSQLDRDRAYAEWKVLLQEVVAQECEHRSNEAFWHRCASRVQRELFPYGTVAVSCMLSGNAKPDYVADVTLDHLPSHAVPLRSGAVILCDGALNGL